LEHTLCAHSYKSMPVGRQKVTGVTVVDRLSALTTRAAEAA
jgi:hypothetical protein